MRLSIRQTVIGLASSLIVAATLTSGALSAPPPVPVPDAFERSVGRHLAEQATVARDAHQRSTVAASTVTAPPDWFERAANRRSAERSGGRLDAHQRTIFGTDPVTQQAPPVASGDGFAWGDAALGAVAAFAIVLLGGAAAMSLRERKRVVLR